MITFSVVLFIKTKLSLFTFSVFSASSNCMTSRSANFNASALDEYANQLLGQIYPPDEQCGLIQGDGSYMCRVSTVISEKFR